MGVTGLVTTLAVSTVLVAYLFYVVVPVPSDIEQRDDVFWLFAKRKYIRGLSIVGETFGFGHRLSLNRRLSSAFPLSSSSSDQPDHSGITVTVTQFDGILVHVYEPKNAVSNGPALIWLHGGGWTTGSAELDDPLTAELSRRLGILVVSVNYRLAPEFPFPIPFDDCVRATVHFMENARQMNVDPSRVAIAGSSAGANLAAAVSFKLRDVGSYLRPSIQVLIVPCLQAFDFATPSYQRNANNAGLPASWMASFWLWYARGPDGHRLADALLANEHTSVAAKSSDVARRVGLNLIPSKYVAGPTFVPGTVTSGNESLWAELEPVFLDPYFAPLMAADVRGVPTTLVLTAEHDVLRDDGIMFARRLAMADVPVEHRHFDHGHHLLLIDFTHYNLSKAAMDSIVHFLSNRL